MQWLSSISVRRPVFATVLILSLVVVGLVGYRSLGVDKFPRIDFPLITVTTIYPGGTPSSIETDISEPIEGAVNTVAGLESLSSISVEGVSLVIAQFSLEKDPSVAAAEIKERIDALTGLPSTAHKPQIKKADPDAAPVVVLAVRGPTGAPIRDITELADTTVRRQLESLTGVGQVTLLGGQKRQIHVEVDPIRLTAAGVSTLEVFRALSVANVNLPGGRITEGAVQSTIRLDGRVASPHELRQIVVRQTGDRPIRVGDVADVLDVEEDAETRAVLDGVESVVLSVRKQSGANTIQVVDGVKAAAARISATLPPGYQLDLVRDNSEMIRTSTSQVVEHLIIGSALAALVVLLFLGSVRSTIIAAVAIPVSIISTFALISWFGFTLNLMTLLALALAVGIVIDDAIVVLENIHRFIHEKGMKPFPAAIAATKEIGLAVLATTLSLMAVFLPVAFMSGIVGRFLMSFGLTMAFAIGISMLVSFTLTPMMAARMLPPPPPAGAHVKPSLLERMVNWFYKPIERGYVRMLAFALRRRWVVGLAVVATCATVPVTAQKAGFGFLPLNDEAQFEIYLNAPPGTSLESTTLLAERLARGARTIPEVTHTVVTVADSDQKQANLGKVYVRLSDPVARARSQHEVMEDVRENVVVGLPEGTRAAVQLINDFSVGTQSAMVSYVINGPELERLEEFGRQVVEDMRKVPGVVDLDTSLVAPTQERTITVDIDRAAALGVDLADLNQTVMVMLGGAEATTYEENGRQYEVLVRAAEDYRINDAALGLLTVTSRTTGASVRLSDLVRFEQSASPAQISRQQRERAVYITCNVKPGFAEANITAALGRSIEKLNMPAGYRAEPFGQSKEAAKVGAAFGFAFLLSFIFMYLVLAAQFESWVHPFTIMLALPLTLPFALLSLLLFGQQLNIFSMLGLLVLFGVVKKNAILQVDQTNQLRARGMPRNQAVLEANRERLRPILMTTFAFVAGMLPLVWSNGIGAGFSKAMAGIIVGGQTFSLLLTLLAVPVAYTWLDDLSGAFKRLTGRIGRTVSGPPMDRGEAEVGQVP